MIPVLLPLLEACESPIRLCNITIEETGPVEETVHVAHED